MAITFIAKCPPTRPLSFPHHNNVELTLVHTFVKGVKLLSRISSTLPPLLLRQSIPTFIDTRSKVKLPVGNRCIY